MDAGNGRISGKGLQLARVAHSLRQRDLAALVGVPPQRISDWELGLRAPTRRQIEKLRQVFSALGRRVGVPSREFLVADPLSGRSK